jgi:glycosyltransferase involved in cell wall biosynthesis
MNASRMVVMLHELSLTGAPRLTLDLLEAIRPDVSMRIVTRDGGPLVNTARALGPTVVLRSAGLERVFPRRLATERVVQVLAGGSSRIRAAEQAAVLRRWNPQLAYVATVAALPLVPMLRLGNVPVVLHVHELDSALAWFERAFPGLIRSVPDRYVAVSDGVARVLVDQFGVPAEAISVVSPYVLPPIPEVPAMSGTNDRTCLVVGGAGTPGWRKGIDLWLLAAREAADRLGPDGVRFAWVGYKDNLAGLEFRTMISKLGLDEVVELVPETDRPHDHFARFDMFAMTSWEDPFPLVVLEAMAMGVPVICFSPTGGPAEEVGDTGVVIPEISPHLMADAIVDLAQSPQRRREMGIAGARRVRDHFRRDKSVAALTQVLDAAVKPPGHR